jgi:pilus assembly protein CpaE
MNHHSAVRLVALARSEETRSSLAKVCTDLNGTKIDLRVGDLEGFLKRSGDLTANDVLLLEIDPRSARDASDLQTILQSAAPRPQVVVTAADVEPDDVRRLMRMGVVDVLPGPVRQADLVIALDHAARVSASVTSNHVTEQGKIICFLKGGGGVGATTIATQGACVLATRGQPSAKVCLLDLDLQFGTVGLKLDLSKTSNLVDLVESPTRLDHALLRSAMAHHECGVDVMVAPTEMVPLEAMTPAFLLACLAMCREVYDYVLVDLPPAWTSWTYGALTKADAIVVVSQLTVASIRRTVRQLETLRAHDDIRAPFRLALNRHDKGWGICKSGSLKTAEKALGRKFDYFLPNQYRLVTEAADRGQPISKIQRRSKLEKALNHMMADLKESVTATEERVDAKSSARHTGT